MFRVFCIAAFYREGVNNGFGLEYNKTHCELFFCTQRVILIPQKNEHLGIGYYSLLRVKFYFRMLKYNGSVGFSANYNLRCLQKHLAPGCWARNRGERFQGGASKILSWSLVGGLDPPTKKGGA
jgi:hypothetical protein